MLTSALVHINKPALVELTDDGGVRLRHSLVLSAQQDALDLSKEIIRTISKLGKELYDI